MDYDLIVVKTLEKVYKNYYYIIRGEFLLALVKGSAFIEIHRKKQSHVLFNTWLLSCSCIQKCLQIAPCFDTASTLFLINFYL